MSTVLTDFEYVEFQRMSRSWTNSPNLVKKCVAIWLHYFFAQVLLAVTLVILYIGMMLLAAMLSAAMG